MPRRRGAIGARALASELADVLRLIIEPFGFVEPVSGSGKEKNHPRGMVFSFSGADYGARTRHLDLGKVALYQMS